MAAVDVAGGGAAVEALAQTAKPDHGVMMVPAFTGLGAPWWDAEARGAIFGMTRDTGLAEIAQAALDACALQTRDLIEAEAVAYVHADIGMLGRRPADERKGVLA